MTIPDPPDPVPKRAPSPRTRANLPGGPTLTSRRGPNPKEVPDQNCATVARPRPPSTPRFAALVSPGVDFAASSSGGNAARPLGAATSGEGWTPTGGEGGYRSA